MAHNKPPSPLETEILGILWKSPKLPAREVLEAVSDGKKRAYTSVLTYLQIMERKGLVIRERVGNTDHWEAAVSEESIAKPMLKDVVRRLLGGRRNAALQYLFDDENLSTEELSELEALIQKAKRERS